MRSIQFRAWDKALGEMYTDLSDIHFDKNILYSIEYTKDWSSKKGVAGKYIELMQSTGLTDKNDKMIYEGDIIIGFRNEERASRYEVYFDNELLAFCVRGGKTDNHPLSLLRKTEIIGNIYQSPELLK